MDKGRTGSQGPEEEPDENTTRRNRPQRPVRRADGVPNDRRKLTRPQRPTGSTNPTGRVSPSGNNAPGPVSRRLPPPPPSDLPGGRPPIRRATRPEYSPEELDDDTYPRQPRPPRSRRLANDPDAQPPVRRNPRPQPPSYDPDEEYYERRPRSRRLPEEIEEDDYERRPRSRRLPEEIEEDDYERRPRSRRLPEDEEEYYERRPRSRRLPEDVEEDEEEEYYEQRPRSRRLADPPDRNPPLYRYSDEYDYSGGRPRRKRRRVLPMVLTGCGLIIFTLVLAAGVTIFLVLRSALPQNNTGTTGQVVSHTSTQTLNLMSVTRIQVCNKMGSVTVTTDANASAVTVTTTKIVPQNKPTEAQRIVVEIPTPGSLPTTLVCKQTQATTGTNDSPLIVNLNVPDGDRADVTVTLPTKVLPLNVTLIPLNIEVLTGDITVTNFNSNPPVDMYLDVKNSGNILAKNVILGSGSTMHTDNNVTFSGILTLPTDQGAQASYHLQSEHGDVNVTLPSTTNVMLDACTNSGKITSQFPDEIKVGPQPLSCSGTQATQGMQSETYYGPLDPAQTPPANTFLVLHTSIGNIVINKAQV